MIQVIPFLARKNRFFYLYWLGVFQIYSALRLNAVGIEAQVNTDLEIKEWEKISRQSVNASAWEGQDLWFSAEVDGTTNLSMLLLLYDPINNQMIYHDHFQVPEDRFLTEWEQHLMAIIGFLRVLIYQ